MGLAPMPPFTPGYGMSVFGADPTPAPTPAATPSALDRFKAAMGAQNSIVPVKNGYLLGGSLALALLIYGSYEGWFKGRRRK
jgi:hypothetical protein